MKIQGTNKIVLEDMPSEHRSWLGKLISPLNQCLESVYAILRNNVSIADNMASQITTIQLQPNQTTFSVSWSKPAPTLVLLGRMYDQTGASPSTYVGLLWTFANGTINITLTGVPAGIAYSVTIVGLI